MKSNVFKIGLPLAVVAFGLASAASTSSIGGSGKLDPEMGVYHISHNEPCKEIIECDNVGGFFCKAPDGLTQLYSLESNCTLPLKRSTP